VTATDPRPNPYELLGGDAAVRQIVNRFYDLMETEPEAAALRALHAADLGPMRERLSDWLTGWLGGPAVYVARHGPVCIASAHAPFVIDAAMRDQWLVCMNRALEESNAPAQAKDLLRAPLARMAEFLRNH
jgi:hemoglobin